MQKKLGSRKGRQRRARQARVARRIARADHTRLTVFRSAKHIYAQLIDPVTGKTVASVSSRSKQVAGDGGTTGNVETARRVGQAVAAIAREKQINRVVFNRNGFLYHGRVKALGDAAREAGLKF